MSQNKEFFKQCIGCQSYRGAPYCSIRRIPYIPKGLICPCSICLIKVICGNACQEFEDFIYKLKEIEGELCRTLFKGDNNGKTTL